MILNETRHFLHWHNTKMTIIYVEMKPFPVPNRSQIDQKYRTPFAYIYENVSLVVTTQTIEYLLLSGICWAS